MRKTKKHTMQEWADIYGCYATKSIHTWPVRGKGLVTKADPYIVLFMECKPHLNVRGDEMYWSGKKPVIQIRQSAVADFEQHDVAELVTPWDM